ncbi:MAG: alkaline phosphatase family protein [Kofleriaceae bacterium]
MMKRRDALKTIGGLASVAGAARFLPSCGDGDDGPVGITTYVFMMMENRSYDHYFGARSMLEGLPGNGLTAAMSNPNLMGQAIPPYEPERMDVCVRDPNHGWDASHAQFNAGANDGFVRSHEQDYGEGSYEPMQYLTRTHLPVSWALADAYTICDRWHASVMGPTWPNRFYWHTGTSGGLMANQLPGGRLPWPSLYHRLQDKAIDWAYYFGSLPVLGVLDENTLDVEGKFRRFQDFLDEAEAGTLPPVSYIDPVFFFNDDHPPVHPIMGQQLLAAVYTALATSPQWKNCMLVVAYDEHGGFFDHVPPPLTADDHAAEGFDQMGFRVPAMVIGPYAKQGHVSSVLYDHTSPLKHLETMLELQPLTMRSTAANDLSDTIDLDRLARGDWADPIELPAINLDEWPMGPECDNNAAARHPIIEWADAHPERIAGLDLRSEIPEYSRAIRQYLARRTRTIAR